MVKINHNTCLGVYELYTEGCHGQRTYLRNEQDNVREFSSGCEARLWAAQNGYTVAD